MDQQAVPTGSTYRRRTHDLPGVTAMGAQAKRSVLGVEGEAILRRMICAALEIKGFSVLQADNGEEALRQLSRHPVDLLLTNWNMPKMSGRELLARLRANVDGQKFPVVVFSGDDCPVNISDSDATFDVWIKKPILISKIQKIVIEMTTGTNPSLQNNEHFKSC